MTQYPDLFAALAAPFDKSEVKFRQAPGGRQLPYVTARSVMIRLDGVLGPECWWDSYQPLENSVICHLSIKLPDGQVVTKSDVGAKAGMADQGDDDKSGFSDAFKRASVKFGVARSLYNDGIADFGVDGHAPAPQHSEPPRSGGNNGGNYNAPPQQQRQHPQSNGNGGGNSGGYGNTPRSGKALFAWSRDQEQKSEVGLIKYLNGFGSMQGWPARMVDWDEDQVRLAHAEAMRKLESVAPAPQAQPQQQQYQSAAPTVDTVGTRQANEFALKAQRTKLVDLVNRLCDETETEGQTPENARKVLDAIGAKGRHRMMDRVGGNTDAQLLADYIATAEVWIAELNGGEIPGDDEDPIPF